MLLFTETQVIKSPIQAEMKNTFTFIEIRKADWKVKAARTSWSITIKKTEHLWTFFLALVRQHSLQTSLVMFYILEAFSKVCTTNFFFLVLLVFLFQYTHPVLMFIFSQSLICPFTTSEDGTHFSFIPCSSAIAVFNVRSVDHYSFVFCNGGNQIGELPAYFKWSSWARY